MTHHLYTGICVKCTTFVPPLAWFYKDALEIFSNFPVHLYYDLIFHGKINFLWKPATNSNFLSQHYEM